MTDNAISIEKQLADQLGIQDYFDVMFLMLKRMKETSDNANRLAQEIKDGRKNG